MKKNYINKLIIGIAVVVIAFHSCSEDKQIYGPPTISKVTLINSLDSAITAADMGEWVAIHGENLFNIEYIKFNDIEVNLKEIYSDDKAAYTQVPKDMPTELLNKIFIKTSSGSAEKEFIVNLPPIILTMMQNEYTQAGEILKIYGKNFSLYQVGSSTTVVSFGGIEEPVISASEDELLVKIPEGVPVNSKIEVINKKFDLTATCPGYYKDTHNMITNFDPDFPYSGFDGSQWVGKWPNPEPLSGNYLRFESSPSLYPDGLGWLYLFQLDFDYTEDMILHPENYILKFEINMEKPFMATQLFFYYYWDQNPAPDPIGGEIIKVKEFNQWETMAIPLDKIIPRGLSGDEVVRSFNVRIQCFAPTDDLLVGFDNFRIYQKETFN